MNNPASESPEPESELRKSDLLDKIQSSHASLLEKIRGLSDDQLTRPGSSGWSIKDHLAHLAAWEAGMVALLQHKPRLQAMGLDSSVSWSSGTDEINDRVHQRHAGLSLSEVLQLFDDTHRQMLQVLETLTEEDLYRPYASYVPDGSDDRRDPVIYWVVGNTFKHFDEHREYLGQIIAEREAH